MKTSLSTMLISLRVEKSWIESIKSYAHKVSIQNNKDIKYTDLIRNCIFDLYMVSTGNASGIIQDCQ